MFKNNKKIIENVLLIILKVWILTGDKEETAITVCRSANHFTSQMSLIRIVNCENFRTFAKHLFDQLNGIKERQHYDRKFSTISNKLAAEDVASTCEAYFHDLNIWSPTNSKVKKKCCHSLKCKICQILNRSVFNKIKQYFSVSYYLKTIQRHYYHGYGAAKEMIGLVIDGKSLQYALRVGLICLFVFFKIIFLNNVII